MSLLLNLMWQKVVKDNDFESNQNIIINVELVSISEVFIHSIKYIGWLLFDILPYVGDFVKRNPTSPISRS